MNRNLQLVFEFIRMKCINCEDASLECYNELSDFLKNQLKSSSAVCSFLNALTVLGMIRFDHLSKKIMLTRKGKSSEYVSKVSFA